MQTLLMAFSALGTFAGFFFSANALNVMYLKYSATNVAIVSSAIYAEATAYGVLAIAAFVFALLCEQAHHHIALESSPATQQPVHSSESMASKIGKL